MRTKFAIILPLFTLMSFAVAQHPTIPNLMPLPSSVQYGSGRLAIDSSFSTSIFGFNEPRLQRAAARPTDALARETGLPLNSAVKDVVKATLTIHADHASKEV